MMRPKASARRRARQAERYPALARWLAATGLVGLGWLASAPWACGGDAVQTPGGAGGASGGGGGAGGRAGAGGLAGSGGEAGGGAVGGCAGAGASCVVTECALSAVGCGDCLDNDGDGLVDMADPECLSPCDYTEENMHVTVVADGAPCSSDCMFDWDKGSGNDQCYWDHRCDPLEVPPDYSPEGLDCVYDPEAVVGPGMLCAEAFASQSPECLDFCLPITPNGCDCFGCCELPAASGSYVWINSEDEIGDFTCELEHATDPTKCKPCTPVPSCINPCLNCELCIGKPELPPGCGEVQQCPAGRQPCGLGCQPPCPAGEYCLTGCCTPAPT